MPHVELHIARKPATQSHSPVRFGSVQTHPPPCSSSSGRREPLHDSIICAAEFENIRVMSRTNMEDYRRQYQLEPLVKEELLQKQQTRVRATVRRSARHVS